MSILKPFKLRKFQDQKFLRNQITSSTTINAAYLTGVMIINSLGGMIFWWVAAKFYNSSDIGLASTALSTASLLSGLAGLGLNNGILRFLPDSEDQPGFLNSIFFITQLTSLILGSAYLIGIRWFFPSMSYLSNSAKNILIFTAIIMLLSIGANLQAAFRSKRKSNYWFLYNILMNIVRLILILIFKYLGFVGILFALSVGIFSGLLVSFLYYLPKIIHQYRLKLEFYRSYIRSILFYSFGNYLTSILDVSIQPLLLTFVLHQLGPSFSGYTSISLLIGYSIASPGLAWAGSAFAEMINTPHRVIQIFFKSLLIGLLITTILSLTTVFISPFILSIFGDLYKQEGTQLLRWLSLSTPFIVFVNFFYFYLRFKKNTLLLVFLYLLNDIILLGVSLTFIGKLGITSIGLAWVTSYGLLCALIIVYFMKQKAFIKIE